MTNIKHTYHSLKENILKEIEENHISPHARGYFLLKSIVLVSSILLLSLITLYIISLILFTLGRSGILLLSPFGFFGVFSVLNDLPWLLVFIACGSLILTLFLAKEAFHTYRLPLIYLFLFSIGFVGISGLVIAKTRIHPVIIHRFVGEDGGKKPRMPKYFRPEGHNIYFGSFVSTSTDGIFEIVLREGEAVHVRTNADTKIFSEVSFEKGSRVLIFGQKRGDIIFADAIRDVKQHDEPKDDDVDNSEEEVSSMK